MHLTMWNDLATWSILFAAAAAITYPISVYRGAQPHVVTRMALGVVLTLSFVATYLAKEGAWEPSTWLSAFYALQALVVLVIMWLKRHVTNYPKGEWTKSTIGCLGIASLGGICMVIFHDAPEIGIGAAVLADFVAFWPAFGKLRRQPKSDAPLSYALGCIGAGLALAAEGLWWSSLMSMYLVLLDLTVVGLIYRPELIRLCASFKKVSKAM